MQKEPVMLIVDSQVHIWDKGIPTNPAHRQISSFTKDDLLQRNGCRGRQRRRDPSAGLGSECQ